MQNIFFSKDFLETLNLRAFNKFSLDQDFSDLDLTCSSQLPVFEKSKTQVLMERSILYHCTIHKEGRVEYRITLARD